MSGDSLFPAAGVAPCAGLRAEDGVSEHGRAQSMDLARVGGVLTLLWHPQRPGWWDVYHEALDLLHVRQAWCAPVRDIGAWWERMNVRTLLSADSASGAWHCFHDVYGRR